MSTDFLWSLKHQKRVRRVPVVARCRNHPCPAAPSDVLWKGLPGTQEFNMLRDLSGGKNHD